VRLTLERGSRVVVKVGTTALVGRDGTIEDARLASLCDGIVTLRDDGIDTVLVSSGAIAAGIAPLGMNGRPVDIPSLQAAAAVGQGRLFTRYGRLLGDRGVTVAQLLLTRYDFMRRVHYLNARNTLDRLLALGALPIVNENDTVAVDEIRFGDNDRLAALVANLAGAALLVLLTDASGVHAQDPRRARSPALSARFRPTPVRQGGGAGGRGTEFSSGGMASKIAAAWVATFSGAAVVVADASEPNVLARVRAGERVGTYFHPHPTRLSARRLWIAFAQPPQGTVVVDEGARRAVIEGKRSLLAVGVVRVEGTFGAGDTVDVAGPAGRPFARGLVRYGSDELAGALGRTSAELSGREVIHRDQLVVLSDDRGGEGP
jgi:glutamate 5-kinase